MVVQCRMIYKLQVKCENFYGSVRKLLTKKPSKKPTKNLVTIKFHNSPSPSDSMGLYPQ